ncbi:FAS1 domain-containing protein [Fimicolochytrium jonesii]|uniref:FAS1 domain-containing protein n=1 Tax=Fimicolochytrium jonesii TaxID=1396493 RepID=UPI0022FED230|nr:FAS1 domain-containing protein [Fimicolochytrium jonesii]KAI8817300.1 FAS1 domain-containing protein [Fimicolochytrium jonesii]
MKIFSILLLASSALAAPGFGTFVSQYENDGGRSLSGGRKGGEGGGTIVDRLRDDKRFSRFVQVLERERGLRDDLDNRDKETTVFAPTNEAFKRFEDEWRNRRAYDDEDKEEWIRQALKYHIAPDSQIAGDALHAGALIPTNLRLRELGDRHQRVRVFRFAGDVWLNMHARIVEKDLEAENGRIHAIDNVLHPPRHATEMLYTLPTEFSTFLAALERTELADKLDQHHGVTVFAPSNRAWKNVGFENLKYLFSCVGQRQGGEKGKGGKGGDYEQPTCQGLTDLKKIIKYHVATDVAYSTDMMQKKELQLKTFEGQTVTIRAKHRQDRGRGDEDEDTDREWSSIFSHRRKHDEEHGGHHDVRRYHFTINDGEARISFTDGLARNGAIQVIDNVMIPKDVKLPHDQYL